MVEEYKCNICNKIYSSYKSLWKHNKNIHNEKNNILTNNNSINTNNNNIISIKKVYNCKYCNKNYNFQQSKWYHEQKCSTKIKNDENEKNKKEIEVLKLKLQLEKTKRLNNKSFKAINQILKDRANEKIQMTVTNGNLNNHSNNNNQITNVTNNILQIQGFGNEEIVDALTIKDKKIILNSKYLCLEKFIEIAHCSNYTQFKNIIVTNLKDNFAYKFDEKLGYFIITTKNELLGDLINHSVFDIEAIYDELSEANKIDDYTKNIIQKFLDKIQDENTPFLDQEEEQNYDNYKKYKIDKIKILLYNNQDKITKDIALLISN